MITSSIYKSVQWPKIPFSTTGQTERLTSVVGLARYGPWIGFTARRTARSMMNGITSTSVSAAPMALSCVRTWWTVLLAVWWKSLCSIFITQAKEASHSLQIPRVPYDGSQRAPAEHRKSQAQSIPVDDFDIDSQLNVLSTLTIKQYKSSQKLSV